MAESYRYDPSEIEPRWQRVWNDEHTWEVSNEPDGREEAYVLEMLPYPSGEPHVGHLKNYSVGDAVAHFRRRQGCACCIPWATTPSGCRPRTTRSAPVSTRASPQRVDRLLPAPVPRVGDLDRLVARVRDP